MVPPANVEIMANQFEQSLQAIRAEVHDRLKFINARVDGMGAKQKIEKYLGGVWKYITGTIPEHGEMPTSFLQGEESYWGPL